MLWPEPPPRGRGCWICANGRPVVQLEPRSGWIPGTSHKTRGYYALCFTCLARWFPDQSDEWVGDWLSRQAERSTALALPKSNQGRQLNLIPEAICELTGPPARTSSRPRTPAAGASSARPVGRRSGSLTTDVTEGGTSGRSHPGSSARPESNSGSWRGPCT